MTQGSLQLRQYLRARRAGVPTDVAANEAGIGIVEARLHDKGEEQGEYSNIDTTEMAAPVHQPLTAPAEGTVDQRESVNGSRGSVDTALPMVNSGATQTMENYMPKHDDLTPPADSNNDPLIDLASETLRGDIRDRLLDWFKAQPKAWPFLSEREQKDLADAVDSFAYGLIAKTAKIIAAGERPTIVARLVEYKEKDGVEAKLKLASTGEVVAQLHEACGQDVLLVATGAEDFSGQRGDADIDPDQRKLRGIGDEYDEAA